MDRHRIAPCDSADVRHIGSVLKPSLLPKSVGRCEVIGPVSALLGIVAAASDVQAASSDSAVQWKTNYYAVTGATPREIRASISQSRPWKTSYSWDGFTTWKVTWRFQTAQEPDGCRLVSFRPEAVIATTLPRWNPPSDVKTEVKQSWQRFFVALSQHEAGHARFAYGAVEEMRRKMAGLPVMACDELKRTINDTASKIMEDFRRRERDYDKQTQHGATQGARLR